MRVKLQDQLLRKEMTRKEFLQFIGGGVAIILGFGNLLTLLNKFSKTTVTEKKVIKVDTQSGFGTRKFGV